MRERAKFLAGVIEGFYGKPWTEAERFELFEWMEAWGLDTFLYAPKDDLKHRARWREKYSADEADALRRLAKAAKARGIRFIYALAPGFDISYSSAADISALRLRFDELVGFGCLDFALLFDDIPDNMRGEDANAFGAFAKAQAAVASNLYEWLRPALRDARFLFCPTPYCGRMANRKLGGDQYLETLGEELAEGIDVLWTGPEIISREITIEHIEEIASKLLRKPMIWDNLHANDYDLRRFYGGPYAGRPVELRDHVAGVLTNPNCEFPLNYVPLWTMADWARGTLDWDARSSYLRAMWEWHSKKFKTAGERRIDLESLIRFTDCFYLPHEDGWEGSQLFDAARKYVRGDASVMFKARVNELKSFFAALTELNDRELFHALWRRAWELREELDLLEKFPAPSDFHLPGTYRGGFVARLQQLLKQNEDGSFSANS